MRRILLTFAFALVVPGIALAGAPTPAEVARGAEQLLSDAYAADAPGAAVLVMRGDEVLFRGARGLADVATQRALTPDDVFRIGSISKQFAAAGVLKLAEDGKLSLSDPLSKFVPGIPNGERITVGELLDHTAGVANAAGDVDYPLDQDRSTAELIQTFAAEPPAFAPGKGWAYSNTGYVLVGAVIEAASGQPWHAYLRSALFEPLGLAHTGYGGDPALAVQVVPGYRRVDGQAQPAPAISMTIPHAGGALVSTVDDLAAWNRALHAGRVLQDASYRRMITPTGRAVAASYGLGIEHHTTDGEDRLEHTGRSLGFASVLVYLPASCVTVVVLQNSEDGAPEALARKLEALARGPAPAIEATAR